MLKKVVRAALSYRNTGIILRKQPLCVCHCRKRRSTKRFRCTI